MKKKNFKSLNLNKESVSQLFLTALKGGRLPDPTKLTLLCTVRSYCDCISDEFNCHSNNLGCNCDTSGNCG